MALGNHTWSHPDLTTLGDREVAEEISRNRDFLRTTFGVRDSPFFRPPFGARDERTDRIAADVGHPTIAMWNGTLGDSRVLGAASCSRRPGSGSPPRRSSSATPTTRPSPPSTASCWT